MISSLELRNCLRKILMFKLLFHLRGLGSHQTEVLLHVVEVNDALLVFFKSFSNFCPDVVFTKDLIYRQLVPSQCL